METGAQPHCTECRSRIEQASEFRACPVGASLGSVLPRAALFRKHQDCHSELYTLRQHEASNGKFNRPQMKNMRIWDW